MTKESKTTIESKDFIAVEIICTHCKTVVSRQIETWQNSMDACPNCTTSWKPYRQSLLYLEDIATRLRHLSALPGEDPTPKIAIRFQVESEEKK